MAAQVFEDIPVLGFSHVCRLAEQAVELVEAVEPISIEFPRFRGGVAAHMRAHFTLERQKCAGVDDRIIDAVQGRAGCIFRGWLFGVGPIGVLAAARDIGNPRRVDRFRGIQHFTH